MPAIYPPPQFSPNPTLLQMQQIFAQEVALLISYIGEAGYDVTVGDFFRDPRLHGEVGEKKGYGHPKSCHKVRLAADLNLFKDGKFLGTSKDHRFFGEWWKARSKYHRWGGDFDDGNHYSFEWNGMR